MVKKRGKTISVHDAITTFLSKAKMGPDNVCTCLMYKQNFVVCNRCKYTKASNELLQVLCAKYKYISNDDNLWFCSACDSALSVVTCQYKQRLTICS